MAILDKLDLEIKTAMKGRNQARLDVVRMIKAAAKNKEIELLHPLTEAEFFTLLTTLVKQRRESIEQFSKGGRTDLAKKEEGELVIVQSFLPQAIEEAEVDRLIGEAIAAVHAAGPKDMGAVMKQLKEKTAGRVDNKFLSDRVRARLSSLG